MKSMDFNSKLELTKAALSRIIMSEYPTSSFYNPVTARRHRERVAKASDYYDELMEFNRYLPHNAHAVAKNTFERLIRTSDYAEIEEGEYIRIATICNYPNEGCEVYVWLTPINEL